MARLAGHPNFQQADVHTGFIPVSVVCVSLSFHVSLLQQHQSTLFAPRPALTPYQVALAALSLLSVEASNTNISEAGKCTPTYSGTNGIGPSNFTPTTYMVPLSMYTMNQGVLDQKLP